MEQEQGPEAFCPGSLSYTFSNPSCFLTCKIFYSSKVYGIFPVDEFNRKANLDSCSVTTVNIYYLTIISFPP